MKKAEEEKLSIAKCKEILNKNGNNYSDEEVKIIRDFFYVLAEIDLRFFQQQQELALKEKLEEEVKIKKENNESKIIQLPVSSEHLQELPKVG